jgi:hypothetical protein
MPLALNVGCQPSGASCDVAFVFKFLCWSDDYLFVVLRFTPVYFSVGMYFVTVRF